MTTHPMHLFDSGSKGLAGEPARPVRLPSTTQNDVFWARCSRCPRQRVFEGALSNGPPRQVCTL